jgi:hypothetical protein
MLHDAIKARIPLISCTTDDLVHCEEVLQSIAGPKKVHDWGNVGDKGVVLPNVYWTLDEKVATLHSYQRLKKAQASLVVINPSKPSSLMFDGGMLPAPPDMLHDYLKPFTQASQREALIKILKGLSLKTASEVVDLTIARTSGLLPHEVRKTRLSLTGGIQGLIPLDTDSDDFYVWPPKLEEWLTVNQKFFESENTPHKLVPRGVMLAGPPGVGKTMAARAVARRLGTPLYRLDISQALNRYIGESENRVQRSLILAEQESPCVILLDEIEKIFNHSDDTGVITRILSTLLWWLNEHRSRVLTVMTTNAIEKIPPELYRAGRLDMVLHLPKLSLKDAKQFCLEVFKDISGHAPAMAVQNKLREAIEATGKAELAHSEVADIVYDAIKKGNWLKL